MKERDFLKWIEAKVLKANLSDNEQLQSELNQIRIKFMETFDHELNLFAPHEIIEDCLKRNGMKVSDLKERGAFADQMRMKVLKELYTKLSHIYTKTAIADMLNISPNVMYWATNQSQA